jgi:uncharacterized protein YndB with AHSA1/START domain
MSPATIAPTQTLVVTRNYSAPIERVFAAWTDASQLSQWFGPSDEYTSVADIDLRVGGNYRIAVHHVGGNVHTVIGTYQIIDPPKKLAFTWNWDGSPAPDTLVTIDFTPQGNSTEVKVTHEKFLDTDSRDKHNQGWAGGLNRLERYLASTV